MYAEQCRIRLEAGRAASRTVRDPERRMTHLVSFGESGKNFIEIGKRPKVQETMLRLAVP
jgi:hypothetical protein